MNGNSHDKPRIACVIPARHASTRFPGKPLAPILGKPMIQWVCEAARRVEQVDEVLVATDDERIRAAVESFGVTAVMTRPECPSGTDRIQEALRGRAADIVVNIQGDEPGMQPGVIHRALTALLEMPRADVATACVPIRSREEFERPHVVKVVRSAADVALYFSRSPIPSMARANDEEIAALDGIYGYKHLGLYVYRRESLEAFVRLEQGCLEKLEKLEQLRFLEIGATIVCPTVDYDTVGVDTPEDIPRAEEALRKMGMA